ncbi:class II aldolase/adducin family protein [Spirochaeta thermophila DSM 6578]|uniref:Class II aldolase/adducin family protein n=1 Tax=Winmispira thermophila (strain ATCC 700085 / DSM 6578 / Z-1203) TaxID=869211 RepID=G0GFI4_WINT7|nr:class II aldolase/adducin family protein [Spirochaeta thermophila]AEJ61598.1 class II aldolase/adducin family protein [Spirochaeta thermophila DSM 6578]
MSLQALVKLSRLYGADPEFVLAGGGNTSWKDEALLYVKASGVSLATIDETGFVRLTRECLERILSRPFPERVEEREREVVAALLDCRIPGEEKRPSVETLLHHVIPYRYVVHTHPALVNGVLCSLEGERIARELFGEEALWMPYTTPGYVLSREFHRVVAGWQGGELPRIVFLQNHGVFVSEDSPEGVIGLYARLMERIRPLFPHVPPPFGGVIQPLGGEIPGMLERIVQEVSAGTSEGVYLMSRDPVFEGCLAGEEGMEGLRGAFSPDHIVYAGPAPLFFPTRGGVPEEEEARSRTRGYLEEYGVLPRIFLLQGVGVVARASSEKGARTAILLFHDALRISLCAQTLGGPRFLTREDVEFILNWEAERFRSRVSLDQGGNR